MALGLTSSLQSKKLITPGIVTDNLVLKHNYNAGSVISVSDGAVLLDGSGDYVNFGNDSSLQASGSLTYAMWVYRGTNSGNEYLVAKRNSSGGHMSVFTTASGVPQVYFGTQDEGTASESIPLNKWTHYALTYQYNATDDAVLTHYINGAVQGTHSAVDTDGAHVNNDVNLTLGFRTSGGSGHYWDGAMCNFGYWHTVLTQSQIKSIMNKNYAGLTDSEKTNLVGWWNLDPNSIYQNPGDRSNSGYWGGKSILVYESGATDGSAGNSSFHEAVVSKDGDLSSDLFGGEGTFDSGDTGYFNDSGGTYGSGAITFRNTGYNALQKIGILTTGKIYRFDFDVLSFDSDILKMQLNWGALSPATYPIIWEVAEGTGSFSITFKAPMANAFVIYATGSGGSYKSITLDNLVMREVQNAGEVV